MRKTTESYNPYQAKQVVLTLKDNTNKVINTNNKIGHETYVKINCDNTYLICLHNKETNEKHYYRDIIDYIFIK